MQDGKKYNSLAALVVLAVVFGSASGLVTFLVYRDYFDTGYGSFANELNFSNGNFNSPRLEIKEPKKVVVEQNDKVDETINSSLSSMVSIFKRSSAIKSQSRADGLALEFYRTGQSSGDGLIVTSDGWIVTATKLENIKDYVIVTSDRKVFDIDKILSDKATPFFFLHVNAKDFPVKRFAEHADIRDGQLVIAMDSRGRSVLTSISDRNEETPDLVRSSDVFFSKIRTLVPVDGSLALLNLGGDIVGLIDNNGGIEPINHLSAVFASLIAGKNLARPSLGVNYVDLSEIVMTKAENALPTDRGAVVYKSDKGVAVIPSSPAALAGLKEGDIIISIENFEINKDNNLTEVLQNFQPQETVSLTYLRGGEKREIELKIAEAK